jgi:hypothetical protein
MAAPFLLLRRARDRLLAVVVSAFLASAALIAEASVLLVARYVN